MGKKKSKIAKKKQAKQASRKFGVVVKKATGGREQSSSSAVSVPFQDGTKKSLLKKSATGKKRFATLSPKTHLQHAKNEEHDDFERQMASAQERSQAGAGRVKTKKSQLKLTPATLIVDDKQKSTSRLLQETTFHLESGLNGIGAAATVPQHRSLAAYAASSNAWANYDLSQPCTLESDNRIIHMLHCIKRMIVMKMHYHSDKRMYRLCHCFDWRLRRLRLVQVQMMMTWIPIYK